MDLSDTIVPKSDQLNADDFFAGPQTFTIREVVKTGTADQPVHIFLVGVDRPFKPSKTVRRLLVHFWGRDGAMWTGKRFTLYRDEKVKWAGAEVGGIRVSHMSHIGKGPQTVTLTVSQNVRGRVTVQPLADDEPSTPEQRSAFSAAFAAIGLTDPKACLDYCARIADRELKASRDLTRDEADRVLAALRQDAEQLQQDEASDRG